MSFLSPRLGLPYLQPAQAQKHVTHNAALQRLDAVTQLCLQGISVTVPPTTPVAGDLYGLGAAPTGAWTGHGDELACWDGSAWLFVAPQEGWRGWDRDGQRLLIWRGGSWQPLLQELALLGIGTSADATNRLALASDASLFSHAGAGHQIKLNKAAAGETASLLFQSGWTGHAEIGLAGDTGFSVRTSADGQSWQTVLRADPAAQDIALAPAGTPRMVLGDAGLQIGVPVTGAAVQSGPYDATPGRLMTVGAFGLGGSAIDLTAADDLDDITASGFYYNGTALNTTGNNYPVVSAGALVVIYDGSSRCVQDYTLYGDSGPRKFVRSKAATGWSSWHELYATGTILGPVSQTGGTPTGAVIESGANANGSYTRWADGTQICSQSIDLGSILAVGSGTRSAPYTTATGSWSYPAAFVSAPALSGLADPGGGATVYDRAVALVALGSSATGSGNINAIRLTDRVTDLDVTAQLTAIGRWF